MTQSVWDSVVGQAKAVEQLHQLAVNHVHAYLFIGPEGCGKDEAARAFAAQLITGSDNAASREADLIMRGSFSDVIEVLREGAAVDKDEAEAIIRLATTTPTESKVKVVIVHEVHLMRDSAAARLLKTIEEPSEKVIFILLADQLVPSLATINSRCIVVQFAANNAYRERLLANDPQFAHRQEAFASIPYKLDGSGATVALIVDEIFELIEQFGFDKAVFLDPHGGYGPRESEQIPLVKRYLRQLIHLDHEYDYVIIQDVTEVREEHIYRYSWKEGRSIRSITLTTETTE